MVVVDIYIIDDYVPIYIHITFCSTMFVRKLCLKGKWLCKYSFQVVSFTLSVNKDDCILYGILIIDYKFSFFSKKKLQYKEISIMYISTSMMLHVLFGCNLDVQ